MLSVPQQTYANVPCPHSLLSLLGTEGFSTKGSLFAVVQISFPMCSESVLFHFPSIPAPLYRHTYPVLSMKSKFTFSRLPQVLAGGQFLCSLLQQKFMKGFPTFNSSLPYPQFTIQPAQKCVMTQSFQEENHINVSQQPPFSPFILLSVIINTPCFWLPGLYSGCVPMSWPPISVQVSPCLLSTLHCGSTSRLTLQSASPMLFLLVSQL